MLTEFFAVTLTSVYHVVAKDPEDPYHGPTATKIELRGESMFPVGHKIGGNTQLIAVCSFLLGFIGEGSGWLSPASTFERLPEKVNIMWWQDRSSPIVALFRVKEDAIKCFHERDLQPVDPRWIKDTREVVDAIGDDHPGFVVSRFRSLALLPQ